MSNLKQKHKDYLIKNEIKDLTDLVNYVEILRNTSNLQGEDRQMLFDFAFLITNEQLSLKSFFAENFRQELYNQLGIINDNVNVKSSDSCFTKTSDIIDEINKMGCSPTPSKEFYNAFKQTTSSPTFMDEVLDSNTTRTEVPNFNIIDIKQVLPKHVFDTIEKQEDKKEGFNSSDSPLGDGSSIWKDVLAREFDILTQYPTLEERNKAIEDSFKNTVKVLTGEANSGDTFELGKKETEGKLNYELDWEFIQQLAERMSQNKGKYKPYNWMQPIDVEKLKQSLFRHVVEVMKGNYEDDGRAFGHLESISANIMMINYQLKNSVK